MKFAESEAILGAWSRRVETSSGVTDGWVKFYLPDDAMLDVLARLPDDALRGQRKSGGKLFMLQLVEIADGDTLPEVQFVQPKEPMAFSNLAGKYCREEAFENFCRDYHKPNILTMQERGEWDFKASTEEKLASLVRWVCSVKSRAELDHNEAAAAQFINFFHDPYKHYKLTLEDNQ